MISVVLNRPKAMNALNLEMIRALQPQVAEWTGENGVSCVEMTGAEHKAFCAGGDVKLLHGGGREHADSAAQEAFFREEYTLDFALSRSVERGAPMVAIWDGVTMGGGVGLSINAPVRVATEASLFAMPETGIGLFPDVGGSYFLPRLPQGVGNMLALTGARVKGAETVELGLATHFVEQSRLEELSAQLQSLPAGCGLEAVQKAVEAVADAAVAARAGAGFSDAGMQAQVERLFGASHDGVRAVVAAVQAEAEGAAGAEDAERAGKWLKALQRSSPTSLAVTLEQLRRGADMSLADCFAMEMRLALRFMQRPDFYEGVHAALFSRDKKGPVWCPATLEEVEASGDVAKFFAPLTAEESKNGELDLRT